MQSMNALDMACAKFWETSEMSFSRSIWGAMRVYHMLKTTSVYDVWEQESNQTLPVGLRRCVHACVPISRMIGKVIW